MGKIISLSGEAQTGKDSFAAPLIERGWMRVSFADNLKLMCMKIFNLTGDQVDTQEGKAEILDPPRTFGLEEAIKVICWMAKTHRIGVLDLEEFNTGDPTVLKTPREILQFIGTDVCRKFIPTYHLDVVRRQINLMPDKNIIITDSRFPNEREMLKREFDAMLIRIKRPGYTPDVPTGHVSETSLGPDSEYDRVINEVLLLELQKKALEYA